MKEFLDMFKGKNGRFSYKRIIGVSAFLVAVLLAFTTRDIAMATLFLSVTVGGQVTSLFEKKN
jgi:hypothetical protein